MKYELTHPEPDPFSFLIPSGNFECANSAACVKGWFQVGK